MLDGFQVRTLDGKLAVDDSIDSIPSHYDDIKKVHDFFNDMEQLEETRQKQLQVAFAAKQPKKEAATETADDAIVNFEGSSAESE